MSNSKDKDLEQKPDSDQSFFIQFAYPTVSGALHVGHLRSYVPPDIQARFRRLQGQKVFFPLGFHATGIDSLVLFDKIKANPAIVEDYKIPVSEMAGLETVFQLEKLLERRITRSMKDANLSLDYDAAVATLDPHYSRFIEWQMAKLLEKSLIVKRPYRLPWCPTCDNPVALDAAGADIKVPENVEEIRIIDYNMIKFSSSEGIFPIATLRPETIFGVTNLWFNPDAEYVRCNAGKETWILARDSVQQLLDLGKKVVIESVIDLKTLEQLLVTNPINGAQVPLVKADFVSPQDGTGVVMSVPAHDPHDYLYLIKERPDLEGQIRAVITNGSNDSDVPARAMINQMGGPQYADLEQVKKRLYRLENAGVMNETTGKYRGLGAEEARTQLRNDLEMQGALEVISELSAEVHCRCGDRIVVKTIPDQWFVDYSNPQWKELAKKCVERMDIFPRAYKAELLETIIPWLRERPLTRKTGLGTVFPYDPGLMIEALADSNIYMAFFPIARRINRGDISIANLNQAFFDYVMLGQGQLEEVAAKTRLEEAHLTEIKTEFDQIYPLDLNMGGMEHKQVHFPFSIFHHVGIFPEEKWQRGLILNWHVILEGKKMSKSDGHVVFWNDALQEYGVDGVRLYIAHGQSPFDNFDWQANMAKKYSQHVYRFGNFLERLFNPQPNSEKVDSDHAINLAPLVPLVLESESRITTEPKIIDQWLISRAHRHTKEITDYLRTAEIRWAVNDAFFVMQNDLKWYQQRGGDDPELLRDFVCRQLTMLSPYIPQTVEELAEKYFPQENLTAFGAWPRYDERAINLNSEELEEILIETRSRLNSKMHDKKGRSRVGEFSEVIIYTNTEGERARIQDGAQTIISSTGVQTVTVKLAHDLQPSDFADAGAYQRFSRANYRVPEFQFIR